MVNIVVAGVNAKFSSIKIYFLKCGLQLDESLLCGFHLEWVFGMGVVFGHLFPLCSIHTMRYRFLFVL
jgi:hypothetical protein